MAGGGESKNVTILPISALLYTIAARAEE